MTAAIQVFESRRDKMHQIQSLQIHPPVYWQDFEHLCWYLWHDELNDPHTQKNGRNGQAQNGVDVFGQRTLGHWVGVQCKGKDNFLQQTVTQDELRSEVAKAKQFTPPLSEFILATSGPRDAKIQEVARGITVEHQKAGLFSVTVCAWDDIRDMLSRHEQVVSSIYAGAAFTKDIRIIRETCTQLFDDFRTSEKRARQDDLKVLIQSVTEELRRVPRASSLNSGIVLKVSERQIANATKGFPKRSGSNFKSRRALNGIVLPAERLRILGIIAVAPTAFSVANFRIVFPGIDWLEHLRFLRKRRLVNLSDRKYSVSPITLKSLLPEIESRRPYVREWMAALEPLKGHPDAALFHSILSLESGDLTDAVITLIDAAEIAAPGFWCETFLSLLLKSDHPTILRDFTRRERVRYYNSVVICLSRQGRNEESLRWNDKLMRLSKKVGDKWGLGQAFHNGGIAHIQMGKIAKAEVYFRDAVRHARSTRDRMLLGRSLYELGIALLEKNPNEAEDRFVESERVKSKNGDKYGEVGVFHARALLALKRQDLEGAIKQFKFAETAARRNQDDHGQALEQYNIGRTYIELNKLKLALPYLRRASTMAEQGEFADVLLLSVAGEAIVFERSGMNVRAEKAFRKLYALNTKLNNAEDALISLHDIGTMLLRQQKYKEAREVFAKSANAARVFGSSDWIYQSLADSAATHAVEGNRKKALSTLRRFAIKENHRKCYDVSSRLWTDIIAIGINDKVSDLMVEEAFEQAIHTADRSRYAPSLKVPIYVNLYLWRWARQEYAAAIEGLAALLSFAKTAGDHAKVIVAHNQIGICLQTLDRAKEALASHRAAVRLSRRFNDPHVLELSLINLGEVLRRNHRFAEANRQLVEAEQIALARDNHSGVIAITHNRALVLQDQRQFDKAAQLFRKCRKEAKKLQLWEEYVRALHAIANLEWRSGNVQNATNGYALALSVANEKDIRQLRCQISLNYANALRWLKRPAEAINILTGLESLFTLEPDAYLYYSQLAGLFDETEETQDAIRYWEFAKNSARRSSNVYYFALSSGALAELYEATGEFEKADESVVAALENEQDPESRASLLVQRLGVLLFMKKEEEAAQVVAEIQKLSSQFEIHDEIIHAYIIVGDYNWAEGGDRVEALKAYLGAMLKAVTFDVDLFLDIGFMVARRLFADPSSKLIAAKRDITLWLELEQDVHNEAQEVVLWPFRVCVRAFEKTEDGKPLSEEQWIAIVSEVIMKTVSIDTQ